MKVGDLVIKEKGSRKGRIGVITRVYNRDNAGFEIFQVLSEGEILQWSADWCGYHLVKNESR